MFKGKVYLTLHMDRLIDKSIQTLNKLYHWKKSIATSQRREVDNLKLNCEIDQPAKYVLENQVAAIKSTKKKGLDYRAGQMFLESTKIIAHYHEITGKKEKHHS